MLFSVIGWTIIHSLWQCLGLLAMLKLMLGLTEVRRSGTRYAVAIGVMGLAVMGVLATFVWEWRAFLPAAVSPGALAAGSGAAGPLANGAGVASMDGSMRGIGPSTWLAAACPYLTMGWVLGVVFYGGRLVLGGVGLRQLKRSAGVADAGAEAIFEDLRLRMGVIRPVLLLITERVMEPMTFGVLRAVVVLPLTYVSQAPADQLEMILAHELAHIRRRDYVINLLQHIFDALLFFNLFFRMISAAVREEREYCCDDEAVVAVGDQRNMAVALTNLGLVKRGMALGLSAAPERRSFYRRVSRLIDPQERLAVSVRGILAGLFVAVVLAAGLTQCSRSVLAQGALPSPGDRMEQVLSDHQAGYFEQVFHYTKGGQEHELFLVMEQNERQVHTAYLDGARVDQGELDVVMRVLKETRKTSFPIIRADGGEQPENAEQRVSKMAEPIIQSDSVERQIRLKEISGGDSTGLIRTRSDLVREEVQSAMDEYMRDVKFIPLDVEQHELLTRIVTNDAYTAADRQQLNELIRKRQEMEVRVVEQQ